MSVLTAVQRLQTMLRARRWDANASNEFVFGSASVVISNLSVFDEILDSTRLPVAIISIGTNTADEDHHGYQNQKFDLTILQGVVEEMGEEVIVGGFKSGGITSSKGRGILEIQKEVFATIGEINRNESLTLQNTYTSGIPIVHFEDLGMNIAARTYTYDSWIVEE